MALRSDRLDAIVSLSKRRGFVYPSSEIYGGLRASWDYGPLGVELKNNIKRQWWRTMVTERDDIVGLDSSVILAREVWEASGHVTEFVDPLTECSFCHKRYRADHLIEAYEEKHGHAAGRRPRGAHVPELRQPRHLHRAAHVQRAAAHAPGPGGGRIRAGLPAPGDRAGHLHQLQERAADLAEEDPVRHRADRQVVPQRDHPGQLHLPDPRVRADGDGVLRHAPAPTRSGTSTGSTPAWPGTSTSASARRTCGCTSTRRRSCRTTPSARSTSSTSLTSWAPSGASLRASPTAPTTT